MDHDEQKDSNRRSGDKPRWSVQGILGRAVEPWKRRSKAPAAEPKVRSWWNNGGWSSEDHAKWQQQQLGSDDCTAPDSPPTEQEDSDSSAQSLTSEDSVRTPVPARWSTTTSKPESEDDRSEWLREGQEEGYYRHLMAVADGESMYRHNTAQPCKEGEPTLMGLPQELRNKVYRYVLVPNDRVLITRDSHQTPALMRTSAQLERETRRIYITGNVFVLNVHDCWPIAPDGFFINKEHRRHWLDAAQRVTYHWSGEHDWVNLKTWLKIYHADGIRPPPPDSSWECWLQLVCIAFDIVERMKKTPWSTVEHVLEAWKHSTQIAQSGGRPITWT